MPERVQPFKRKVAACCFSGNERKVRRMDDLLSRIEAYRRQHLLEETTFGRLALNDPNLIARLRSGRKARLKTIDKIERFLSGPPELESSP